MRSHRLVPLALVALAHHAAMAAFAPSVGTCRIHNSRKAPATPVFMWEKLIPEEDKLPGQAHAPKPAGKPKPTKAAAALNETPVTVADVQVALAAAAEAEATVAAAEQAVEDALEVLAKAKADAATLKAKASEASEAAEAAEALEAGEQAKAAEAAVVAMAAAAAAASEAEA